MLTERTRIPQFCELKAVDLSAASRLASEVFAQNRFYQEVIGFDPISFKAYWQEFLHLVLDDPNSRLLGAKVSGELRGFVVANNTHFPSLPNGLRFLFKLGRRIGALRLLRYLRFVTWWEGFMRRPREEQRVEMRGTWILVGRQRRSALLGIQLARWAMNIAQQEGKTLITGFADAANHGLVAFYRRLGFKVSDPQTFRRRKAVRLEFWAEPQGEHRSC